jgi:cellulose synthase/poly-beta-1,6-N-acetylglucosamine synthase-like glycosyltransferase
MSLILDTYYAVLTIAVGRLALWILLSLSYNLRRKASAARFGVKMSIVVPAFNEERTIAKTIRSLLLIDYPDFEVIVVDDGSKDGTLLECRRFEASGVKVIHQENGGKPRALNRGIDSSEGTIIVTVDADTTLHRDALRQIANRFTTDPRIGAIAGNVKVSPGPGLLNALQAAEYTTRINLVRKAESVLGCVTVVPGPIAAFRREAIQRAGPFSADTFAEDFDMTMEVLRSGYRVEYEDRALAYTEAPRTLEDLMKQRRRWYRGMIQVLSKHRDMYLRRRFGVPGIFGVPSIWFDVTAPFLNAALILLALFATVFAFEPSTSLIGLAVYFAMETGVSGFAITLDPVPKAREYATVPLLFFHNLFMDGVRMMSFVEEMVGIFMSWEKPRR